MNDPTEALRRALKRNAKAMGIDDTKAPSRIYCKVIIEYISKVTKKPTEDLAQEILAFEALNQEGK